MTPLVYVCQVDASTQMESGAYREVERKNCDRTRRALEIQSNCAYDVVDSKLHLSLVLGLGGEIEA
jgi:hypothetical protein